MFEIRGDDAVVKAGEAVMKQLPKICEYSEKSAARKGKAVITTKAKGGIPAHYNVKKKEISPFIRTEKGSVIAQGERSWTIGTSTHFSHIPKAYKPKIRQVKAKIKRAYAPAVGDNGNKGFLIPPKKVNKGNQTGGGNLTMIWYRINKNRKSIATLRRLSPVQMASNEKVAKTTQEAMREEFEKQLKQRYEKAVSKG